MTKQKLGRLGKVALGVSLSLGLLSAHANEYYSNQIPGSDSGSMYYALGGGNEVPDAPSIEDRVSAGFDGILGGVFSCGAGTFNPKAAITNAINGIKNSFQNMFNDAVSNATGALQQMPAYMVARANPSLYQLLQNGFQSGQFSFGMAVKSCTDVQNDLENGKDPVTGFVHSSTQADWQGNMLNSQSYGLRAGNGLTYEAAQNTDINTAKEKVEEDNGKKGVVWVKGVKLSGNKYAGGDGQPSIKLTHDIVIAGANAMIGKDNYEDSQDFPRTSALKHYWANSDELAQWAKDVLGERVITTYSGGDKTAIPGKGLLAKVQVMFSGRDAKEGVYQKLMNLVSGADALNVKNLRAVSTSSVIINRDIINDLRHQSLAKRAISINVLAQGIASGRVIDQAQMLKEVLQTAEQVPAIARNTPAQDQIQKYLATLQDQINMVVNFKETNQKLITSSIQTIVLDQAQEKAAKSSNRPTASDRPEDLNQITKEKKQ